MAQDGQTIGIPIGPDCSRLIAEIICSVIDENFVQKTRITNFLRHVDDIWIGADNVDEAHRLLSELRNCLREFELDVNEKKTRVASSTEFLDELWPIAVADRLPANEDEFFFKREGEPVY